MASARQRKAGKENGHKASGIHFRVPKGFHVGGWGKGKRKSSRKSGRKAAR